MAQIRERPAVDRVKKMIPNNVVRKTTPYLIMVRCGGFNKLTVRLALVQTSGQLAPTSLSRYDHHLIRVIWNDPNCDFVATTKPGTKLQVFLPSLIALRDALNAMHQQNLTVEHMEAVKAPVLKQRLVEFVCLNSL